MKKFQYVFCLLFMMMISPAWAEELIVWCSGGLMPVIEQIAPRWQQRSGITLHLEAAPSMGIRHKAFRKGWHIDSALTCW